MERSVSVLVRVGCQYHRSVKACLERALSEKSVGGSFKEGFLLAAFIACCRES